LSVKLGGTYSYQCALNGFVLYNPCKGTCATKEDKMGGTHDTHESDYNILVENPKVKSKLGRPSHRREDDIKVEGMDWVIIK
jgi:hypothetical protein